MIRNIQITKKGSESDDSNKTLFTCPNSWEEGGANLVLYKNSTILKKDTDYEVQDKYTVKLLSSAKVLDEINFVITQIVDPSEMISHDERMYQLDKIDKKFEGKAQTSIEKRVIEETIPSRFIIHSNDIWTSKIQESAAIAQKEHTALPYTFHTLTEDKTVAHEKGWYASTDGTFDGRISDWIPPEFGKDYLIRLYDATNNEIPSSDTMNWRWDYQAGYLTIENDFEYQTPFKIKGYKYDGRYGVGSLSYWKEPVFAKSELPLYHNDDGDIRLVSTENKFYRFDSLSHSWDELNYGSASFRDPVLNKDNLPPQNNMRGDIRLVLDESNLYVWDDAYGLGGSWILLTGQGFDPSNYYDISQMDTLLGMKSDKTHTHDTIYLREEEVSDMVRWRPARENFNDLPPHTENKDGDVVLTKDTNTIYRWYTDDPNTGQGHWDAIFQSNFSWKTPVEAFADLPLTANSPGDTRLVTEEQKVYFWTGEGWSVIVASVTEHHHDDRYLLKTKLSWHKPVDTFDNLPTTDNEEGDTRLTLDTNMIYRWHDGKSEWVEVLHKSSWIDPALTIAELPPEAEENDVIYVRETNQLYVWNGVWTPIEYAANNDLYYTKTEIDDLITDIISSSTTPHTHDGVDSLQIDYNNLLNIPSFYWKNPVSNESELPLEDNTIGDARIALESKAIYVWDGSDWALVSAGSFEHDHNDVYYSKQDVQDLISGMVSQIDSKIESKADVNHDHDDDYYLKSEIDIALADKASIDHTHDFSAEHNHDDRYPTFGDLSSPGGEGKVHWDNILDKPDTATDQWQTPVVEEALLPPDSMAGDLRLVLNTSDVWRYNGYTWVNVGHWLQPTVDYWKEPVASVSSLPNNGNMDGDIRLTRYENQLYRWNAADAEWQLISGGTEIIIDPGDPGDGSGGGSTAYREIQVYINGLQGIEGEDWEMVDDSSLRVMCSITYQDVVTVLIMGDTIVRHDFRGIEGRDNIVIQFNTFYRKEFEISEVTSLIELPVTYNPSQNDLVVWRNGLIQKVDEDYIEASTSSFTFIEPLQIGERLIVMVLGFTTEGRNYLREDYVLGEGQTIVELENSYEPGMNQLLVYVNGVLQLVDDNYTEVDINTVSFLEGAVDTGDSITFIILKGIAIAGGTVIKYASELLLGFPTDGRWSDGYVELHSEMNVADAIDELNEAIFELIPDDLRSLSNAQFQPENIEFSSGFVADGNDFIEGMPGDYFDYLTKNREFYLHTPENSFVRADQGIVRLFVNGVQADDFNLGNAFVETDRDGFQTPAHYGIVSQGAKYTTGVPGTGGAIRNSDNGYIQVMSVQKYGYRRVQRGHLRFKFYNGLLRHGYNYIYITHSYGDKVDTSQQFKFFLDTKHQYPTFTGTQTLYEQNVSSDKYVSGIRYYSIGDSFRTTFNVTNIAYTVYSAEPFTIDMPGLQPINVEYNDPNLGQLSDPPHIDDIAEYKGTFVLNEFNEFSIDGVVNVQTHTPFRDGETYTFVSKNRLINTYTNGSSALVEYFRDEIFRLPIGNYDTVPTQRSYVWDSTQPLNNGDALLFDRGLRYANMSFIDYLPAQSVDYSSFSGPQQYVRAFFKNTPRNNGRFIIDGITKNDLITSKIIVDLKLPTQTGWLSLNKYYEVSEFDGQDGDGCLIDVVDNQFYYSSGTFSTAYSGFVIIVRITLPNDAAPVMKYLELKW